MRQEQKKRNIEKAIAVFETKLEREVCYFRKCAQEYDVDFITNFLPALISNIQATKREVHRLKNKQYILELLSKNGR